MNGPIIIIGMHRSGTGMLVRMLEQMGLFIGKQLDTNHEAIFFQNANQYLLRICGGIWDHPLSIDHLRNYPEIWDMVTSYLYHVMNSRHVVAYLGWSKFLRYRTPSNLSTPWGWKDPRNTYTLPAWLELFPEAGVIHIYRHGVDVANSLKTRNEKEITLKRDRYRQSDRLSRLRKRVGFVPSLRCMSLEGGFSLWEEYLQQASQHIQRLGDQAVEIKYEDFLGDPVPFIKGLSEFCHLTVSPLIIDKVVSMVSQSHAYAHRNIPELLSFSNQVSKRLRLAGY